MERDGNGGGDDGESKKHFVLVHGLCHGAFYWYKVVTALRAAGHRVTALDLAASGVHPARIDEVHSFEDYSRPLLDAVAASPPGERLVLVAHSHGGLSVALAAERFPRKVAAAVFVSASMPCVGRHMGLMTEEFTRRRISDEGLMDTKTISINNKQGPGTAILLGPIFMAKRGYQLSPAEDLTLATTLVRPGTQFVDDPMMKDETLLTDAGYGSVKRVFVIAMEDAITSEELQRWMVALSPGTEVVEIAGADHAVMTSKPKELCEVLAKVGSKYD